MVIESGADAFQNYFQNCSVGMSVTSPAKKWLEVNQSLCQMLGYSNEELSDKTWIDLTYPEDVEKNQTMFSDMIDGKIDRPREVAKVGDTEVDVREGQNAGCKYVIGVTTGIFTRQELEQYNPTHIIDDIADVITIISK